MAAFSISATTPVWQASATEPNTGMSATVQVSDGTTSPRRS